MGSKWLFSLHDKKVSISKYLKRGESKFKMNNNLITPKSCVNDFSLWIYGWMNFTWQPWVHCTIYQIYFLYSEMLELSNRAFIRKIMISTLDNAMNGYNWHFICVAHDMTTAPCFLRKDNNFFQHRVTHAACAFVSLKLLKKYSSVFSVLIFCRLKHKMQQTSHHKWRRRARAARWTSKFYLTLLTAVPFMLATLEILTAWHRAMAATSSRWVLTCWQSKGQQNIAAYLLAMLVVM